MNVLLILIPVTLVLVGIAVAMFFWAVNKGQFDDLDTPALRILEEDPPPAGSASPPQGSAAAAPGIRQDRPGATGPESG